MLLHCELALDIVKQILLGVFESLRAVTLLPACRWDIQLSVDLLHPIKTSTFKTFSTTSHLPAHPSVDEVKLSQTLPHHGSTKIMSFW